jgi:hypothetical protein
MKEAPRDTMVSRARSSTVVLKRKESTTSTGLSRSKSLESLEGLRDSVRAKELDSGPTMSRAEGREGKKRRWEDEEDTEEETTEEEDTEETDEDTTEEEEIENEKGKGKEKGKEKEEEEKRQPPKRPVQTYTVATAPKISIPWSVTRVPKDSDLSGIVQFISECFMTDPCWCYLVPEEEKRLKVGMGIQKGRRGRGQGGQGVKAGGENRGESRRRIGKREDLLNFFR